MTELITAMGGYINGQRQLPIKGDFKMKNIKKIGAVFLSSVIMSGFSSLFVSAEDFNNDLGESITIR